jgi:hypothetical protein
MNSKNLIGLLIILVVAGIAGYFYFYPNNNPFTKNNPSGTEEVKIEDKKLSYNENPLKVNITYPQITGLDEFNKLVKAIVDEKFEEFKTNSLANDEAVKKIDPESYAQYPREYELMISYQAGQVDKDVVSVVFEEYSFEGGAHGATNFITLNYDVKTKKEIKLVDLFPGQADYLQKISNFCIADLTKQMTASGAIDMSDSGWINEGAGPKEENYSVFLINPDNTITFYFQQYQVAAGAAGDFTVIMPR